MSKRKNNQGKGEGFKNEGLLDPSKKLSRRI